ncbi:MAG TPA: M48 family metallopeptidase [Micropepsaceae bacterium]|nr:M48 family metallopeptidase [Micropepsaceae bacterium]
MRLGRSAGPAFAAALLCALSGTAHAASSDIPAPGYRPALDTDEGGLWAAMDREEEALKVSPALVKDDALNDYVKKIVCDLAPAQCSSLRVYIVDDPSSNAMTAPNGMVIVWTGLLLRTQNEAELAFILGHEITHYLKRHSLLNFETVTHTAGAIAVLSASTGGIGGLLAFGAIGALASYSRDQEREADAGGFDLVTANGYDPRQGALFMANTAEEEDANPNRTKPSAYLSSHPATKERLVTLSKRAGEIESQTHAAIIGADTYGAIVGPHRAAWLEEEFNRGDYAQSVVMINQLLKLEPESGLLQYYAGEAYRRRNGKGDVESAMAAYQAAIAGLGAPAAAHRGLGMVALKAGQKGVARDAFQKYLSLAPDAGDRATVQYYLTAAGASQ